MKPETRETLRTVLRWLLAGGMVAIGVAHFTHAEDFVAIVPPLLPWPLGLVWISGVFEILGGIGILPERSRRWAGIGLIALYVAVFPANIYMAVESVPFRGQEVHPVALWGRLPFQLLFIAWAWWVAVSPSGSAARRG